MIRSHEGHAAAPSAQRRRVRTILSGLGWESAGQVGVVLVNLALTPFLLVHLGADRYGLFALIASMRGLLWNLDGGLGPTATRYLSVAAGAGDRRRVSALVATIFLLLLGVLGAVTGVVGLLAPHITALLHTSRHLHDVAITLLRAFMPLLVASALRTLFQRVISAEQRWAYVNITQVLGSCVYGALAVLFILEGRGLFGLFWACVGEEVFLALASVAGACRSLGFRDLRLLPASELHELVSFASRVQIAEIASAFYFEIDAILVGVIFPIRDVGYYTIGANFATQLAALPANAIEPISVMLSRTFGQSGLVGTLVEFTSVQRLWVRAVAAFPFVGAVSAYFGIIAWLGPRARLAGLVAMILLVGQGMGLLTLVMDRFGKSVRHPELESRYLGLGAVANVALTIPLALTAGVLGVPAGTTVGEIVSGLYLLRLARRRIGPDVRSSLTEVPLTALVSALALTTLLELGAARVAPQGAGGLALCALPALAGLALYALILGATRHVPVGAHRRVPVRQRGRVSGRARQAG